MNGLGKCKLSGIGPFTILFFHPFRGFVPLNGASDLCQDRYLTATITNEVSIEVNSWHRPLLAYDEDPPTQLEWRPISEIPADKCWNFKRNYHYTVTDVITINKFSGRMTYTHTASYDWDTAYPPNAWFGENHGDDVYGTSWVYNRDGSSPEDEVNNYETATGRSIEGYRLAALLMGPSQSGMPFTVEYEDGVPYNYYLYAGGGREGGSNGDFPYAGRLKTRFHVALSNPHTFSAFKTDCRQLYDSLSLDAVPLLPGLQAAIDDIENPWNRYIYVTYDDAGNIVKSIRESKTHLYPQIAASDVSWTDTRTVCPDGLYNGSIGGGASTVTDFWHPLYETAYHDFGGANNSEWYLSDIRGGSGLFKLCKFYSFSPENEDESEFLQWTWNGVDSREQQLAVPWTLFNQELAFQVSGLSCMDQCQEMFVGTKARTTDNSTESETAQCEHLVESNNTVQGTPTLIPVYAGSRIDLIAIPGYYERVTIMPSQA